MTLSVTRTNSNIGSKELVNGDIVFGSYQTGGMDFDPFRIAGVRYVDNVYVEGKHGYRFHYDRNAKKIKVYNNKVVPPIVYDEHKVLDENYQFDTNYPAAFFVNVAGVGENIKWRSTGVKVGAGQCCLESPMAHGERTKVTVNPVNQTAHGAFDADAGWTKGTGWSITDGKGVKASAGSSGTFTLTGDGAPTAGHTYRVTFTVSDCTSGEFKVAYGGVEAAPKVGGDGTYAFDFLAKDTTVLTFTPTADTDAYKIDDVIIQDLDVFVNYITQGWNDVWNNLVQDEELELATGNNTLPSGNKVLAFMYADQITATAGRLIPIDENDSVASGEIGVVFNAAADNLKAHANQNKKKIKITYIKVPESGFLKDRLFKNETASKAGGTPTTNTFTKPLLLWGYSGCMPVNGNDTIYMLQYDDVTATKEFFVDWYKSGAGEAKLFDDVQGTGAGVWGMIQEIATTCFSDSMCEVDEGTDLSFLGAVPYFFIGV